VKRDETLLFLFARHARAAVMAGLAVRAICKDVTARYDGCTAQCSIGIGTGPVRPRARPLLATRYCQAVS
jgi:hypothetical protein